MQFDFSRFSPQSFERFIQALAVATTGARAQIYGAGRDGAREATFRGRCRINDSDWDGYVVFQAKYRSIEEAPAANADWLIGQLDKDLAKFEDKQRALERPDYYVLATNVRLSASAANADGKGQGGIDKVTARLNYWANRLGLKDVHLWHADTLNSLLEVHETVRNSYAFWVQPSDVLAALMKDFQGPDHKDVLNAYLRNSLRQAREIKTRDIGQATNRTVALEEVFIDLPIDVNWIQVEDDDWSEVERIDHGEELSSLNEYDDSNVEKIDETPDDVSGVISQLMIHAKDKFELRRESAIREPRGIKRRSRRNVLPNRFLLLGGPGQGKSTVGQFLAQLCRARILNELQEEQTPEINATIQAVLGCAESEHIPLTGPLRYPIHVELPLFADALSKASKADDSLTIASYISRHISKLSDEAVTSADLRSWLGLLPSIVILDGLDEVPHSGNRASVIGAIEEFLDAVHSVNADCLILATSRPQGYQDELPRNLWAYWELEPLEADEALRLSARLAPVLISEESRQEEVLSIIAQSASDETTAPLMTTPLQVMLLFQLVSTHNNIPEDRWTLFHRHYDTLRNREISKGGQNGGIISRFRTQIDQIHYDAGFILQVRAESEGRADSYLDLDDFRKLVHRQLLADGYEDDIDSLTETIVEIATDRLVFLRCQIDGRIAFDVRSLQEFMAAARLTASPEGLIKERLSKIAGRAHWLHVFKIACSKIFASTGHEALRDQVIGLLDGLDQGDRDPDDHLVMIGAQLALQLLLDGAATSLPKYRKKLITRSLKLTAVPESDFTWPLVRALDGATPPSIEPLILQALNGDDTKTRLNAQRLLALITRHGKTVQSEWASQLLLEHWPIHPAEALAIFEREMQLPEKGPLLDRLQETQWKSNPWAVLEWTRELTEYWPFEPDEIQKADERFVLHWAMRTVHMPMLSENGEKSEINFLCVGVDGMVSLEPPPADAHPLWIVFQALQNFMSQPGRSTAAEFLRAIAVTGDIEGMRNSNLPWPLYGSLIGANTREQLEARADALESGLHGDVDDWRSAEARLRSGFRQTEVAFDDFDAGIPADISSRGVPPPWHWNLGQRGTANFSEVLDLVQRLPANAWICNFSYVYFARAREMIPAPVVEHLLRATAKAEELSPVLQRSLLSALLVALQNPSSRSAVVDAIEKLLPADRMFIRPNQPRIGNILADAFNAEPSRRKLLIPLAQLARRGRTELDESAFEVFEKDSSELATSVGTLRHKLLREDQDPIKTAELLLRSNQLPLHRSLFPHESRIGARSRARSFDSAMIEAARMILRRNKMLREGAFRQLSHFVESQPVGFESPSVSETLELPLMV